MRLTPDYQELAMKIQGGKLRNKSRGSTFSIQKKSTIKSLNANRETKQHSLLHHLHKFIEKSPKGLFKNIGANEVLVLGQLQIAKN